MTADAGPAARILRPGGRAGITDLTITEAGLPGELTTLAARVACIADARSLGGYAAILEIAGLRVVHTEARDAAIARVIDEIDARIRVLRMTASARLAQAGVDTTQINGWPSCRFRLTSRNECSLAGRPARHALLAWLPKNALGRRRSHTGQRVARTSRI